MRTVRTVEELWASGSKMEDVLFQEGGGDVINFVMLVHMLGHEHEPLRSVRNTTKGLTTNQLLK